MAQEVQDGQYYPAKALGGHSLVASVASGADTIETHEFYNAEGKVIYRWKVKKTVDKEVIDFRIEIPEKPETAAVAYEDYENLS